MYISNITFTSTIVEFLTSLSLFVISKASEVPCTETGMIFLHILTMVFLTFDFFTFEEFSPWSFWLLTFNIWRFTFYILTMVLLTFTFNIWLLTFENFSPWSWFDWLFAFVRQHQFEVIFNTHFIALLDRLELVVISWRRSLQYLGCSVVKILPRQPPYLNCSQIPRSLL